MKRFKVILTVALTLLLSVSVAMAVTMSVSELKELVGDEPSFGAVTGPDIYSDVTVYGSLVDGGKITNASSTLTNNITLTAKQVCESSIITVNSSGVGGPAAAALTVTLPATSTLFSFCLPEEGLHKTFWFSNLSPTAASTTVITAGAGMDLLECDDGDDCNVVIAGGGRAKIEIWRQDDFESNLSAYVAVTEYTVAD